MPKVWRSARSAILKKQAKAFDLTALLDPRQEVRVIVSVVRPFWTNCSNTRVGAQPPISLEAHSTTLKLV